MSKFWGHYFTIAPVARHTLLGRPFVSSFPFQTWVSDETYGDVRITGRIHHAPSDTLLVIVHGLGGDVGSHYVLKASRAAEEAGIASLRLHLRGSERTGEDIYHAALTSDLHAVLASEELARYSKILLLGYSIGGHIVLRAVSEGKIDPRVRAVCAVCPPLDLSLGVRAIDAPSRVLYRRHVLEAIKEIFAEVERRGRPVHISMERVRLIKTIREWDEIVIAPRFGFQNADHYYAESSVAPRLSSMEVPSLIVAARHDPMVPEETLLPALSRAKPPLETKWIDRGGHVGFPSKVDLGFGAKGAEGRPEAPSGGNSFSRKKGLEDQVVKWLLDRAGAPTSESIISASP